MSEWVRTTKTRSGSLFAALYPSARQCVCVWWRRGKQQQGGPHRVPSPPSKNRFFRNSNQFQSAASWLWDHRLVACLVLLNCCCCASCTLFTGLSYQIYNKINKNINKYKCLLRILCDLCKNWKKRSVFHTWIDSQFLQHNPAGWRDHHNPPFTIPHFKQNSSHI